MSEQGELFDQSLRARYDDGTYPDGFWDALDDHMHLYTAFLEQARKIKARGFQHYSARTIIHVLRHHSALREGPDSTLKINDHWSPGFARLCMSMYPNEFADFFETRTPPARREAVRLDGTRYVDGPAP